MAKRLSVKVGEYTNQQGETKGEYIRLGALMSGQNGEYLLLDPTVNIAGCLAKQNMLNHKNGKQVRDSLMVSVFDDNNQQQQSPQPASPQAGPDYGQGGDYYNDDVPF
jgi:hypothetical protein